MSVCNQEPKNGKKVSFQGPQNAKDSISCLVEERKIFSIDERVEILLQIVAIVNINY